MLYAKYTNPNAGFDFDKKNCEEYLVPDRKYIVEDIEMGSWHTTVYLKGFNVPFNSVNFTFYKDDEEYDIYGDPEYNPYI